MKKIISLFVLFSVVVSCSEPKPQPIQYGKEECSYCSMLIMEEQFASELVTQKGKAFKYDSIECMLNDLIENHPEDMALYLVPDYLSHQFIDARQANFLQTESIPSPMGAYLSAFSSKEKLQRTLGNEQGTVFSWGEIVQKFKEDEE